MLPERWNWEVRLFSDVDGPTFYFTTYHTKQICTSLIQWYRLFYVGNSVHSYLLADNLNFHVRGQKNITFFTR